MYFLLFSLEFTIEFQSKNFTNQETFNHSKLITHNFNPLLYKVRELRRLLTPDRLNTDENDSSQKHQQVALTVDDVLVISLGVNNECPGMVPEQKVQRCDSCGS